MNNETEEPLFHVLDWFKKQYSDINFPKEKIYSNKNRYKHINLLQCLMLINMRKSINSRQSNRGDLFDMDIASFSSCSYCFISEDKGLIDCLRNIKENSEQLGFENEYRVYHTVEKFLEMP